MFRLTFVFLCFAAITYGNTLPAEYSQWEGRIVGGNTVTSESQFPHQISLRNGNSHFCGGSIVNSRWIVTAAHCTFGQSLNNMRVVVGTRFLFSGGIAHTVMRIVNHPSYNQNSLANDISLVQTGSVIVMNTFVRAISLSSTTIGNVNAMASGWGQTSHPGNAPNNLQWINLQTISTTDCRNRHSGSSRITNNVICTLVPAGRGMCMGDSGGPLIANNQLIGVVSWGVPCGRGSPDVFTRVSTYRSWILSFTG